MSEDPNKAIGHSISFKPAPLYERAVEFGAACKPARNPSSVICEALTEFFQKRGISLTEGSADVGLLDKISAAIAARPEIKLEIEKLLRTSRRAARRIAA